MKNSINLFLKKFLKIITIMYISLIIKNILQFILGYFFSTNSDIKTYKIYNLKKTVYSFDYVLQLIFLYDFIIFGLTFYLIICLTLYKLVTIIGNKIFLHIGFFIFVYLIVIFYIDNSKFNILFITFRNFNPSLSPKR